MEQEFTEAELAAERWREIEGYEGFYEVSDLGRVRSMDRVVANRPGWPAQRRKGGILRFWLNAKGYRYVTLWQDGGKRTGTVASLVAAAFIGPRPTPQHDVCHEDGTRTNNRASNLRYDTRYENGRDTIAHGTRNKIDPDGNGKQIREMQAAGMSQTAIAAVIGCSQSQISQFLSGKSHARRGANLPATPEQVREARRLRTEEKLTHPEIARRLGLGFTTVASICQGRRYKDVI